MFPGDYFRGLELVPAAGRLILADDDRVGAPLVTVISSASANGSSDGDANAAGQPIRIDNLTFTVVGVTPPEFFGVDPEANPDFYVPFHTNLVLDGNRILGQNLKTYLDRNHYWIEMMGRLRPGVRMSQAQAVLALNFTTWVVATATNERELESLPALTVKEGAAGLDTLRRRYSKPLYVLWTMGKLNSASGGVLACRRRPVRCRPWSMP